MSSLYRKKCQEHNNHICCSCTKHKRCKKEKCCKEQCKERCKCKNECKPKNECCEVEKFWCQGPPGPRGLPGHRGPRGPTKASYNLVSNQSSAGDTTLTPIAYFPWDRTKYADYKNGKVILYAVIPIGGPGFIINLVDGNNNPLSATLTISSTGIVELPFNNPTNNTYLVFQIALSAVPGINYPFIYGVNLEFDVIPHH